MRLDQLWLTDFRNYPSASVALAPSGLTVIVGSNGSGKSNLLEAVGWLATLSSFRGAPTEALIRSGASATVVRGSGLRDGRELLIEGSLSLEPRARTKVQVNRQPLRRARDLLGALRVSVFSPDDLVLIKGGPSARRTYLDELLVSSHVRWDALLSDVDRILRQRGVLLKQAGGRLSASVADTLDVWDSKLAVAGSSLASARADLVASLAPVVAAAYASLVGPPDPDPDAGAGVVLEYVAPWRSEVGGPGLAGALALARGDDVRRGISTVGPHRDDLSIVLDGLPSRTHASQGEQRSLALALRLGGHSVVSVAAADTPVLLLDDVFSELDPVRSSALLASLPAGQAVLTTSGPLPSGVTPALSLRVAGGVITEG